MNTWRDKKRTKKKVTTSEPSRAKNTKAKRKNKREKTRPCSFLQLITLERISTERRHWGWKWLEILDWLGEDFKRFDFDCSDMFSKLLQTRSQLANQKNKQENCDRLFSWKNASNELIFLFVFTHRTFILLLVMSALPRNIERLVETEQSLADRKYYVEGCVVLFFAFLSCLLFLSFFSLYASLWFLCFPVFSVVLSPFCLSSLWRMARTKAVADWHSAQSKGGRALDQASRNKEYVFILLLAWLRVPADSLLLQNPKWNGHSSHRDCGEETSTVERALWQWSETVSDSIPSALSARFYHRLLSLWLDQV